MKTGKILFSEEQKLRESPVRWILLISYTLVLTGLLIFAVSGELPKEEIPVAFGITIPVLVLSYALIHYAKLKTVVTEDAIIITWKPFVKRMVHINKDEIQEVRARKAPLFNKGFGLIPTYGAVHNVKGKEGFQIYLKNGRKVYIGTQESFLLRKAIEIILRSKIQPGEF